MSAAETDITEVLTASVVPLTTPEVEAMVARHFRLDGRVSALTSERDQNFRLVTTDGSAYVVKITNPAEDSAVTRFQTNAFRHMAQVDPALPVPHLMPTTEGAVAHLHLAAGQTPRTVRVMTFLSGRPMNEAGRSSTLRRELGHTLARLGLALRGYFHAGAGHELLWDIQHSSKLRPLLEHIPDAAERALATRFLDRFEAHALPVLPKLRAQVIHNDFQPWNVLVDSDTESEVTGVIDFGDMVFAPLIDDLAVACAYHIGDGADPLAEVADIVAAYHAVVPLEPAEADILCDLIAARQVMTVAITNWRAGLHPENADYILRNAPVSWAGLTSLEAHSRDALRQRIRQICQMEPA